MQILRILLAAALLSSCASAASIQFRDTMRDQCKAGNPTACGALPGAQEQVDREASDNGRMIAAGLLIGLVAGAASYNNTRYSRPDVIIVRPCRWC